MLVEPPEKLVVVALLVVPLALLPVRSWYSLPGWLVLASRFLSARAMLWVPYFHYDAVVWAIFFGSALSAASRSRNPHAWPGRIAACLAGVLVITAIVLPRAVPLYKLATPRMWVTSAHDSERAEAVAFIPHDACVVADDHLIPRLTRTNVVARDFAALPGASWLVVDIAPPDGGGDPGVSPGALIARARAEGMQEVRRLGSVTVYRAADAHMSASCMPYYRRVR